MLVLQVIINEFDKVSMEIKINYEACDSTTDTEIEVGDAAADLLSEWIDEMNKDNAKEITAEILKNIGKPDAAIEGF
jgi:transcription elongation factor Elf1